MKRFIFSLIPVIIIGLSVQGCATAQGEHSVHWGYEGHVSPEYWGSLKEEYRTCSTGKLQTPINIVPTSYEQYNPLNIKYHASSKNVINNGHSVQVNISSGSTLNYKGTLYELKQFHFHTPSENNIYGNSYPLEAHFVHASKAGKLAVISVMFKYGKDNKILSKIWSKFPLKSGGSKKITLSADTYKLLMPKNKEYYSFIGSLTTPPCTEGVEWIVYKNPTNISKTQTKQFFDIFEHTNNRPLQKVNSRKIIE